MKVTLHFKNKEAPAEYHMNAAELKTLINDFDSYITNGTPRKGMYNCQSDNSEKRKAIYIDFDAISMIA